MDTPGHSAQLKWNKRYQCASADARSLEPAQILSEYGYLLPDTGAALDLACGLGGNALYMARRQLRVDAWDLSDVAIGRLIQQAESENLAITAQVRDVLQYPPSADTYDVIVVSRFLERTIIPSLIQSLKPAGLVFYQTFSKNKDTNAGPNNPAFLLDENELLRLFSGLTILVYHEEGQVGDCREGLRNEAALVAQKRVV